MNRLYAILLLSLLGVLVLLYSMRSCMVQREVTHTSLIGTLSDSLHVSHDKEGTHYTKQAFTSVPTAQEEKLATKAQKHLLKTVKATRKPVAVVETSSTLSYAGTSAGKLASDSIISFSQQNDTLMYKIRVNTITHRLYIDSLQAKSTATVAVHEVNREMVTTVTNSNPLLTTNTVEGYTPAPKKKHTFLKVVISIAVGIVTGAALTR